MLKLEEMHNLQDLKNVGVKLEITGKALQSIDEKFNKLCEKYGINEEEHITFHNAIKDLEIFITTH